MKITGKTRIVGVIGDPIAHTRSPAMHNAAFEALGMDWVYVPFHVRAEDLADAVAGFRALGVRGINATLPHKQALLDLVDDVTPEAAFIGAVNTLTFEEDGSIHGDNTDARGFLAAMDEAGIRRPKGETVVVLGAGGATRAVVAALATAGVRELFIANRTLSKAERLAEEVKSRMGVKATGISLDEATLQAILLDAVMLVNTTSGGMHGHEPLQFNGDLLQPPLVVYDIIYAPPETELLKAAAENGCDTLNGIGMLVHQGAIAFEMWTERRAPIEVMRKALLAAL